MFGLPKVEIVEGEADVNRVYIRWIGPRTYEAIIQFKTKYPKVLKYGGDAIIVGIEAFSLYKNRRFEGKLTQVVFNNCTVELVEDAQRFEVRCIVIKKSLFSRYHMVYDKYGKVIEI